MGRYFEQNNWERYQVRVALLINQYQPIEQLLNLVEQKFFNDLEIILNTLDPNKKQKVTADIGILGHIHHALNLDKYDDKKFRKTLFKEIPPRMKEDYFKFCEITSNTSYNDSVKQTIEFEWGSNKQTKNFVTFFKYPKYLIPHSEKNNEKYESYKMLFDFQSNAVFNTLIKIKNPFTRALIQMPTGTGKTRTAVDIMIRLLKQKNESLQIIWFANKSELLDQAYEAFENAWGHVGNEKINIIKFWGEESMPKIPKGKCVYFVGYQKFRSLKSNIKSKIKPDYIFVDEAHQILAKTYEDTIDSLIDTQKSTRLVGLTATPGRGLSDVQNERLTDKFNDAIIPLEIFDKEREEAYEGNIIQYLEDEKILAKAIGKKLFSDFEYELTPDEWRHLQELHKGDYPEFSSQFFKKLTNDNIRNTLIIDELKKYAEEGKKILYFSTDIDQAKLVYVALQKLNISAVYVNEETDKKFRKQIIKTFKETDEISVICNFNIFSTGFDVPDLDVIFIGRPINSPVLFNQIVGRGTRGEKMGAKKSSFLLVQVIDKIQSRFHDFDPYAQYGFWDKYWKK